MPIKMSVMCTYILVLAHQKCSLQKIKHFEILCWNTLRCCIYTHVTTATLMWEGSQVAPCCMQLDGKYLLITQMVDRVVYDQLFQLLNFMIPPTFLSFHPLHTHYIYSTFILILST